MKSSKRLLFSLFSLFSLCQLFSMPAVFAQTPDTTGLRSFLEQRRKELKLPGLSYSLVQHGKTISSIQLGKSVSHDSYFLIGSMSKSFTALAALLLAQDGKIALDSTVSQYLPHLTFLYDGNQSPVTVRDVLNQTSGFSRLQGFEPVSTLEPQTFKTAHPRGEAHHYSNINYVILGLVLEKCAGKPLQDIFEERIFIPAGMDSVFSNRNMPPDEKLAPGHQMMFVSAMKSREPFGSEAMLASGGLILNASHMETYLNLAANADSLQQTIGLADSSRQEWFKPHLNRPLGYAMGWVKRSYKKDSVFTHQGLTGSYSSAMWIRPSDGLGIAVLTNSNTFGGPVEVLYGSLQLLHSQKPEPIERRETYFRWGIMALLAVNTYQFGNAALKWNSRGRPLQFGSGTMDIARLGVGVTLPIGILFAVERYSEMPVRLMMDFQPDLGYGLIAGSVLSIATAVFKGLK